MRCFGHIFHLFMVLWLNHQRHYAHFRSRLLMMSSAVIRLSANFSHPKKKKKCHDSQPLLSVLTEILTSTPALWTWLSHSIPSQRCSGTWRNSRYIWGQCIWRTGPSSGWCIGPQRTYSRSARIYDTAQLHTVKDFMTCICILWLILHIAALMEGCKKCQKKTELKGRNSWFYKTNTCESVL